MYCRLFCFVFLLFACAGAAGARPRWQSCLPSDVRADEVASAESAPSGKTVKRVTVAQRLDQLGARCRDRKLVGAGRKEIRFYRLAGCWGNPPADYQDILKRQREEIAALKKRYILVEMACNLDPSISSSASPESSSASPDKRATART